MRRPTSIARDLILPRHCLGCAAFGTWRCAACGRHLPTAATGHWIAGLPVVVAGPYQGVLRQLLLGFKERLITAVAPDLAALLRLALPQVPGPALVVAVPATVRGRLRRGFDPVTLLAHHAGYSLTPTLRWRRGHRSQKTLDRTQRLHNLTGALTARPVRRPVVLIDDVITTGATLAAAAAAIEAAGGRVIGAAAVALTPPNPVRAARSE